MNRVFTAAPYVYGQMGSLGRAAYMLIRQFQFPDTYDDRDIHISADHDRCFQWDRVHAQQCCARHLKTGELGIEGWVGRASEEQVIAFLKDILKTEERFPDAVWTGFRVLGSVHQGNGFPVFTLELFAKHAESDTQVYTGAVAPNVNHSRSRSVSDIQLTR